MSLVSKIMVIYDNINTNGPIRCDYIREFGKKGILGPKTAQNTLFAEKGRQYSGK